MGKITFKVNNEECTVGDNCVSSDMMLVDYLRQCLELRGTKFMCREGGCGACIVSAVTSPGGLPVSVNSCLVSVTQCHGWEITTIEKVGNKLNGYHPIQEAMAAHHATQCGHCTPGWVMAMYSLAQSKKGMTQLEIENSFASNVCRCTGYRPIMDAMKTYAKDAPDSKIADIEDLYVCHKTNRPCNRSCSEDDDWCIVSELSLKDEEPIVIELTDGKKWYKVTEIEQIFNILKEADDDYMLVCGNTAKGAYPLEEYPKTMIDVSGVAKLRGHDMDQNLIVGANTTLTEFHEICKSVSGTDNFQYLKQFHEHIDLVAHYPVKNIGSLAGNLMTKHKHNMFPSDIFLLLETVGAYLTIMDSKMAKQQVTMQEFLKTDMSKKILYNLMLPPLNKSYKLFTYKVMPRAQNVHAVVNEGCLYKLTSDNVVEKARIVIGGLSPSFIRATETEDHLVGKKLFTNEILQSALEKLDSELIVVDNPPDASVEYRRQLALALFYKGILTLCPEDKVGSRYKSAPEQVYKTRPVSKGKQEFNTDPKLYPLNQPMQKVEGLIQCSGEAQYTEDLHSIAREVYCALVLSTVGLGTIQSIDPSPALEIPGVIAFYSAKDIPGNNSFLQKGSLVFINTEEVFCSGKVKYYNQPLGVIVAKSTALAERAAKKVKVTYTDVSKPMIHIKDSRKTKSKTILFIPLPAIGRGLLVHKKFESNYTIHAQMHFCMETMVCVTIPKDIGLEVHCSTQWMDNVQTVVGEALKLDINSVEVYTRRIGGAFGLKVSRSGLTAVACSLVAHKLNRPCRMVQSFSEIARAFGKRFPCSADVKVEVSKTGLVQYMEYNTYEDNGCTIAELVSALGLEGHNNCYKRLWWNFKMYNNLTDTASNTYCRSPGSVENVAMAENIMEQISYELGLDPLDVRMRNMDIIAHAKLKKMVDEMRKKFAYDKRKAEVEKFNKENRWKKRGLRWALLKYDPICPVAYEVTMSVCHADGSVIIHHGGTEVGQGINTKAIQICAYFLGIPVDKIKVKPQNTNTAPNSFLTAASITSQSIGIGVEECCKIILARLKPIKILLLNPSWESLIRKAHFLKVDLNARYFVNQLLATRATVYGCALCETLLDVLTGECQVLRVDLCEDVGQSVSPQIDVGQVEGAFIMGMSYWMFEDVVYDPATGEVLSDRPWNYHVAQCKDIPQDFRVCFQHNYSKRVILGAKVTGEPATTLAICSAFALRHASSSARVDAGLTNKWFLIEGAHTSEKMCLTCGTKKEHFRLN